MTGVTDSGTFARLLAPPAEGRVVRGERGWDVGDKVRLKLLATDPIRGFIHFAGLKARAINQSVCTSAPSRKSCSPTRAKPCFW